MAFLLTDLIDGILQNETYSLIGRFLLIAKVNSLPLNYFVQYFHCHHNFNHLINQYYHSFIGSCVSCCLGALLVHNIS